ncbi:MAG TPA: hypothetical protein VEP49_14140 [Acidimicrobiia bacterium]|nr:hypothetical protein [Acidimicrobiia bacterium]
MSRQMEWSERLRALAQEHVAEPVIAAGLFSPAGAVGGGQVGNFSQIAEFLMNRQSNRRSGGLGHQGAFRRHQALIAVTADKIYGFSAKPKRGSGFQVLDQVVVWDRKDVRTTVHDKMVTKAVTFDVGSTGERFELEMVKLAGATNEAVLAELMPT